MRCSCLNELIYKRDLGVFATKSPNMHSQMKGLVDQSILIEGPMSQIRNHLAGVILDLKSKGKTFASMDTNIGSITFINRYT